MSTDLDPRVAAHARRLKLINADLVQLHGESATLLRAEREAFVRGWEGSTETSVSGREAVARIGGSGYKIERIPVEGQIIALQEERDHIRFVIKYGLWRDDAVEAT